MTATHAPIAGRVLAFRLLALAAAALFLVGLLVGLMPVSSYGVDCGSAFVPNSHEAGSADFYDTLGGNSPRTGSLGGVSYACAESRSARQVVAVVFLVASAGAGLAAGVTRGAASRS